MLHKLCTLCHGAVTRTRRAKLSLVFTTIVTLLTNLGTGITTSLAGVRKTIRDSHKRVWTLYDSGRLKFKAKVSWTNKTDFAFAKTGQLIMLDRTGELTRSKKQFGEGGHNTLATGVTKFLIDTNGWVWALHANGDLGIAGKGATWNRITDFALDKLERVVLRHRSGELTRSKKAFGQGGHDTMAKSVLKFLLDANGGLWALQSDGDVRFNGNAGWNNKVDFTLDDQNRLVMLDRTRELTRSKKAFGNGGHDSMGKGVTRFLVDANGWVWALQSNGDLRVNGKPGWNNKVEFTLDNENRLLMLDRNGELTRSTKPFGAGRNVNISSNLSAVEFHAVAGAATVTIAISDVHCEKITRNEGALFGKPADEIYFLVKEGKTQRRIGRQGNRDIVEFKSRSFKRLNERLVKWRLPPGKQQRIGVAMMEQEGKVRVVRFAFFYQNGTARGFMKMDINPGDERVAAFEIEVANIGNTLIVMHRRCENTTVRPNVYTCLGAGARYNIYVNVYVTDQ